MKNMQMNQPEYPFFDELENAFSTKTFIKGTLSKTKDKQSSLKNVYIKPIEIKGVYHLHFTYRYKTNDQFKNLRIDESLQAIRSFVFEAEFLEMNVFTTEWDAKIEVRKDGKLNVHQKTASLQQSIDLQHDKTKQRALRAEHSSWMQALKLTDADGKVYKNAQDKFKQINHYIELIAPELKQLSITEKIRVVDMGSGKGYLTFALYEYLHDVLKREVEVKGVEFRKDLVDLCNSVAKESKLNGLHFEEGSILETNVNNSSVLVALHACDTATDDAIFKGITSGASMIVVAPCCHKQIRSEMESNDSIASISTITQHGIFMERQAEMLTDTIRGLLLEKAGYSVKIAQFIADAHTPKNVLLTALKKPNKQVDKKALQEKIDALKMTFGIKEHYLEKVLNQ